MLPVPEAGECVYIYVYMFVNPRQLEPIRAACVSSCVSLISANTSLGKIADSVTRGRQGESDC